MSRRARAARRTSGSIVQGNAHSARVWLLDIGGRVVAARSRFGDGTRGLGRNSVGGFIRWGRAITLTGGAAGRLAAGGNPNNCGEAFAGEFGVAGGLAQMLEASNAGGHGDQCDISRPPVVHRGHALHKRCDFRAIEYIQQCDEAQLEPVCDFLQRNLGIQIQLKNGKVLLGERGQRSLI